MLKVTKKQMAAFSKALTEGFYRDATFQLRKKFPVKTKEVNHDELQKIIKNGIEKAESHKITEKEDVMNYLEYVIFFGKDFDTNLDTVWASKILRIRNLTGSEKITRIMDYHPLTREFL